MLPKMKVEMMKRRGSFPHFKKNKNLKSSLSTEAQYKCLKAFLGIRRSDWTLNLDLLLTG